MPVERMPDEEGARNNPGDACLTYTDESIDARITKLGHDRYELAWSDLMVNEWSEEFPSLPIAVVRLAALLQCGVTPLGPRIGVTGGVHCHRGEMAVLRHGGLADPHHT